MRLFETNHTWILATVTVGLLALLIHCAGQTSLFTHDYFSEPNLYHTWPRFDELTHPLSSAAATALILNLNLPLSFRKKWVVALAAGMVFGLGWEVAEYVAAPFIGWIRIDPVDTLLDLHQDFYGSALAVLFYIKVTAVKGIVDVEDLVRP